MRMIRNRGFWVICLYLFSFTPLSRGDDWPNWRGPRHNGRSAETGFQTGWKEAPKKLWEHAIGPGYSGITTAAGKVYTCGMSKKHQILYCFDADTGKVLWESPIEKPYYNETWNGPRCTPTINKGRVYVMGAHGIVACFDAASGSKVWSRQYEGEPQWGYSGSVLIAGKLAIVNAGGNDGALRALSKKTGKEIWKCGSDGDAGYATPYPFRLNGKKYVCGFLGNSVVIADRKTGREVFNMPWKTAWKVNASTPMVHDGFLFLSSGYRTGCGLFKLTERNGRLDVDEVWRSQKMRNKFQTPVLHDGKLYSFDQRSFKCLDFMTGKVEWEKRGGSNAHGTVVLADGHLLALTQDGRLKIGEASSSDFVAKGEAQILEGQCWTVPTLSNGRLYARNHEKIVCLDLRR